MRVFIVLISAVVIISCQTKQSEPTKIEKSAFLAGAILGDNTTCIAGGHPMSAAKKSLFQGTLKDLQVPERMVGEIMQLLHEAEEAKRIRNMESALNKTVEALSKTEEAVKVTQGVQVAQLVRFGPPVMIAVETARMVEIAFETDSPQAPIIIRKNLQDVVNSLENNFSEQNLPPRVKSYIHSVASDFRYGAESVTLEDIRAIKKELTQLLKIYGVRPLTEMQIRGDRVHFEDAVEAIFVEESKRTEEAKLYIDQGMLYLDKGRKEEALQEFESVLAIEDIEKSHPILAAKAHRLVATTYLLMFSTIPPPDKILDHLKNSLRLDPNQLNSIELKKQVPILEKAVEDGNIRVNDYLNLINLMLELLKQDRDS
jgi:tetratricopeptide (TPR) repeat protein